MRVPLKQNSGTLALLLLFLKLQPIIRLYALRNFLHQYIYTPEGISNFLFGVVKLGNNFLRLTLYCSTIYFGLVFVVGGNIKNEKE